MEKAWCSCRDADEISAQAAWLAGVGLAQFGEFGFVVLQLALREKIVSEESIAPLLNAGILSMFLTPLIVYKAPHFTAGERILDPLTKLLRTKSAEDLEQKTVGHNDHVIIIGYGISGQLLTSSLRTLSIETVVLEMNSDNVSIGREGAEIPSITPMRPARRLLVTLIWSPLGQWSS